MQRKKAVIDTTYLLPLFGIRVQGLEAGDVIRLRDELNADLYYPVLLLPELAAKIAKEMTKQGLRGVPEPASEALVALLLGVDVGLIQPRVEHIETAIKLMALGHPDIFDCILYATALHEDAVLVTRDKKLVEFLETRGLNTSGILVR